jgi:hypothetical protein
MQGTLTTTSQGTTSTTVSKGPSQVQPAWEPGCAPQEYTYDQPGTPSGYYQGGDPHNKQPRDLYVNRASTGNPDEGRDPGSPHKNLQQGNPRWEPYPTQPG